MQKERIAFYRNWVAFFLLGTINNLPYVVVNSSAKVLATSFGKDNYVTLVMFANVAFGFFSKGTNALLSLTNFPFWIRFGINGCLMLIGLVGVAYSPNFWIALAAIVIAGCSSSFGENLTLGYLHNYRKECVNAWSSGTGMAGLFGAMLYLLLSCVAENTIIHGMEGSYYFDPHSPEYTEKLKTINKFVFLGTIPIVLLYWLSYFVIMTRPSEMIKEVGSVQEHTRLIREGGGDKSDNKSDCSENSTEFPSKTDNVCKRILRCLRITFWLAINLCLVYFFEYSCRGFAAKSRPQGEYYVSELHCPELYASIQLCYQAGVFVSRSSVQIVQIKRVEIFTILQLINMILWLLQAWLKFLPVYVLPAFMIYVGLLGGASYVNIFYLLRTDKKFPEKDRELCTNITAMWITLGVLLGASFPLSLFKTVLQNK